MPGANLSDRNYHLRYGPAAKSGVKATLDLAVRPHLHDVRAMLRLPLPEAGITAGCNFAAVHVLLNVLSGLSRLMGPGPTNSGESFKRFVRRWYPWKLEPRGSKYRQTRGTETLYNSFRNGFSHDLRLVLESGRPDAKGHRRDRFRIAGTQLGVAKAPSLSAEMLQTLDDVNERPAWPGPTVVDDGPRRILVDAVALYWGVRCLVFDHTSTRNGVRSLQRMIDESWVLEKAAGRVVTIQMKSGVMHFDGKRIEPSRRWRRLQRRQRSPARLL